MIQLEALEDGYNIDIWCFKFNKYVLCIYMPNVYTRKEPLDEVQNTFI